MVDAFDPTLVSEPPGVGPQPAPDLYAAMGGRLTSLDQQLAGFQQELAGMGRQVPGHTIIPPDGTSPMGQVTSVISAMFAPAAGIADPIVERGKAYRAQQLEGSRERRSILQQQLGITKEQADLVKANFAIEKEREAQADAPLALIPGLMAAKTPAASRTAGQLMEGYFARKSILVPPGFAEGLINKEHSFNDMKKIMLAKAWGHDPAVIRQGYPAMPDDVFQSIVDKKIPDHMMKTVDPHWQTEAERKEAAFKQKMATSDAIAKIRKRQGLGEGSENADIMRADGIHRLDNDGQSFLDGTPLSQKMALDKVDAKKLAADIEKQKAAYGILAPIKQAEAIDKENRKTESIDGGKGTYYHRGRNEYKQHPTKVELQDPAWHPVGAKNYELVGMMSNAIVDARRLKAIIPSVLSEYTADNLRQYAQNYIKGKLGGDKHLNEFFQGILKLVAEEARAMGDTAAIRMGIFNKFMEHGVVKGYDTQGTAIHMADQLIWTFANRRNRTLGLDLMHDGQRLGPGKFWAYPVDPASGGPNRQAPAEPIVLDKDEVSPANLYIWESQ